MDKFIKELEIGDIHQRDKWQFELKSDFIPISSDRIENVFTQEFYLFIPNALQIHSGTYDKTKFYQDQTNLIRYKTPVFELSELADSKCEKSPLTRLYRLSDAEWTDENSSMIEDELKLFANIFRSSLRERMRNFLHLIDNTQKKRAENMANKLFEDVTLLRKKTIKLQNKCLEKCTNENLKSHFLYIDEFLSDTIIYHLTGFLHYLKGIDVAIDEKFLSVISHLLAQEEKRKKKILKETTASHPSREVETPLSNTEADEYILYRSNLLNKFVINALLLNTMRTSVASRFRNVIGSIAAGIAMLFFFVLFVHQGSIFLINSSPFILLTVLLYILKDRIKEGLKTLSYRQFAKWFSDYKTELFEPDSTTKVGKLEEYFSFVQENAVPKEISRIRNREFHVVLEDIKRPEQVLYYKKRVTLYSTKRKQDARRSALNTIFRFNIRRFLEKADDPIHDYIKVDPVTLEFLHIPLPKVYHINIILKNTYLNEKKKLTVKFKKFRLILDKDGIKRVESIAH